MSAARDLLLTHIQERESKLISIEKYIRELGNTMEFQQDECRMIRAEIVSVRNAITAIDDFAENGPRIVQPAIGTV